jgi:AraC-like DNA-binding protein
MEGSEAFNASLEYTDVADLIFCRLSTSVPHRVVRTPAFAHRDDRGLVKVVILKEGRTILEQGGRSTLLRPGEWSIYDTAMSYSMAIPHHAKMFLLMMPRDRILGRHFNLANLVAQRFSGRHGLGKLIFNLISDTFDQIPEIRNRSSHDVADIVVQMTRLALTDVASEHASTNSREALRDRIKLYVLNHLGDPDLSITKLAAATGCTKRYLHMAFQPENVSISDHILKARLERCREDLLNPACAHKSITDIAYSWGFNNSNHFSRCFKQAFGVSPRHARSEWVPWPTETSGRNLKIS